MPRGEVPRAEAGAAGGGAGVGAGLGVGASERGARRATARGGGAVREGHGETRRR